MGEHEKIIGVVREMQEAFESKLMNQMAKMMAIVSAKFPSTADDEARGVDLFEEQLVEKGSTAAAIKREEVEDKKETPGKPSAATSNLKSKRKLPKPYSAVEKLNLTGSNFTEWRSCFEDWLLVNDLELNDPEPSVQALLRLSLTQSVDKQLRPHGQPSPSQWMSKLVEAFVKPPALALHVAINKLIGLPKLQDPHKVSQLVKEIDDLVSSTANVPVDLLKSILLERLPPRMDVHKTLWLEAGHAFGKIKTLALAADLDFHSSLPPPGKLKLSHAQFGALEGGGRGGAGGGGGGPGRGRGGRGGDRRGGGRGRNGRGGRGGGRGRGHDDDPVFPPRASDECLACGAKDHRVRGCPFVKAAVDAAKEDAPEDKSGGGDGGKGGGKDKKDRKDFDAPSRFRSSAQRLLQQHQALASPDTVVAWDSCSSVNSLPKQLVPDLDKVPANAPSVDLETSGGVVKAFDIGRVDIGHTTLTHVHVSGDGAADLGAVVSTYRYCRANRSHIVVHSEYGTVVIDTNTGRVVSRDPACHATGTYPCSLVLEGTSIPVAAPRSFLARTSASAGPPSHPSGHASEGGEGEYRAALAKLQLALHDDVLKLEDDHLTGYLHLRHDHAQVTALKQLYPDIKQRLLPIVCASCVEMNITAGPHRPRKDRAGRPLQVLHLDLTFTPHTTLTVTCEHSRFIWSYVLARKSDAVETLKTLLAILATQFPDLRVQRVHGDTDVWAGKEFRGWLDERGVELTLSSPGVSQQNGVAERSNAKVKRVLRSMGAAWSGAGRHPREVLDTAVLHLNTTPRKGPSPFFLLHGKEYEGLRTNPPFGARVYAHVPSRITGPMAPRGVRARWLGRASHHANAPHLVVGDDGKVLKVARVSGATIQTPGGFFDLRGRKVAVLMERERAAPPSLPHTELSSEGGEGEYARTAAASSAEHAHLDHKRAADRDDDATPHITIDDDDDDVVDVTEDGRDHKEELLPASRRSSVGAADAPVPPFAEEKGGEGKYHPTAVEPAPAAAEPLVDAPTPAEFFLAPLPHDAEPPQLERSEQLTRRVSSRSTRGAPPQRFGELVSHAQVAGVPEEPATLKEAMRDPRWVKALREEYDAMERNGVWSAFSGVPPERLTVGLTTKFKVKLLPNGKLDKLKARIVAQGFSQRPETIGEESTRATVLSDASVHVILAHAATTGAKLISADVSNAFLHAPLQTEVYAKVPTMLSMALGIPGFVKLHKSI